MKLLAFNGSPRTDGSTAKLIDAICSGAEEKGHEVKKVNLYSIKISGCRACEACKERKVEFCALPDDITELMPEIVDADCLIIGSPVYFGQISGHTKCLIDRFFTFINKGFTVRYINDKKIITVLTSGAPTEVFSPVSQNYLKYWFNDFMKMKVINQIVQGSLPEEENKLNEALRQAREIGLNLTN